MSKPILIVGGVLVVGLGALFFFQSSQEQVPSGQSEMQGEGPFGMGKQEMDEPGHEMMMGEHTVVYSDSGYSPKELTIKKGDTVTFRNTSTRETWPASAMHPSHSAYPGSSIQKCETEEMTHIFDACMGLKQGEEWSFVFDEVGTWWYHDHVNVAATGTIIVQ